MRVRRKVVSDWLDSYSVRIDKLYGLSVSFDYTGDGAACLFDTLGQPLKVRLSESGIKRVSSRFGADMDDFAMLVWNCKHEERHLEQNRWYLSGEKLDTVQQRMCEHFVMGQLLPEFYWAAYSKDPTEIDADLWAMKETRAYFKDNYPDYDVDGFILGCINGKFSNYKPVTKKFESVDDLFESYEQALQSDKSGPVINLFTVKLENGPSAMMQRLL